MAVSATLSDDFEAATNRILAIRSESDKFDISLMAFFITHLRRIKLCSGLYRGAGSLSSIFFWPNLLIYKLFSFKNRTKSFTFETI
ncbi:hypothetical protein PLCT2_01238 [Planctomycetaceae bacterium]|nr:hypothetical protein PLCT2_01238 [Planctomycetaceae bacterium]